VAVRSERMSIPEPVTRQPLSGHDQNG
jgi:hypothetical protein